MTYVKVTCSDPECGAEYEQILDSLPTIGMPQARRETSAAFRIRKCGVCGHPEPRLTLDPPAVRTC